MSVNLNGSTQYFTVPYSTDFDMNGSNFTLFVKIYNSSVGSSPECIIDNTIHTSPYTGWYWRIENVTGKPQFITNNNGTSITANTAMTINTWQTIGLTIDSSGNYVFYLNGVSDGSGSLGVAVQNNSSNPLWIGNLANIASQYYNGKIDHIKIYKRVLSANEMRALHNNYGADNIGGNLILRPNFIGNNGSTITVINGLSPSRHTFSGQNSPTFFSAFSKSSKGVM